jgi:hypothetical protein
MRINSTRRGFLKTAGQSLGIAPLANSLAGCSISKSSVTLRTTEDVHINNCSFADSIFAFIGLATKHQAELETLGLNIVSL